MADGDQLFPDREQEADTGPAAPAQDAGGAYRVLARKYRPGDFDALIGQEALVRTLTNAIDTGRIAQAFMLTGVRGVGKTTTARIIAKALNCIGPDGTGGPTAQPCGVCRNCVEIAGDRHNDVIEMDAASRTGVDDIRELIDGVRYRPVTARCKVYILDEVHMLSRNAFNALLKTLEEPPEHVRFIFATTEIRKVPVTVQSRCQRFDLRRVPLDRLTAHFADIASKEGVAVEDEALAMIARAADGSVRDGLSILDQAIALSAGAVTAAHVRDMLGLADRAQVFDLFETAMRGDAAGALATLRAMYDAGADPAVVIQDLLDVCYWATRIRLSPELTELPTTPELERTRGGALAQTLGMPVLARAWQMLLKGLGEVNAAPNPIQAAEMVLLRLIYAADLPPPGDLVRSLKGETGGPDASPAGPTPAAAPGPAAPPVESPADSRMPADDEPEAAPAPRAAETPSAQAADFPAVVRLFAERREGILHKHLMHDVHLVRFEPGRIELRPTAAAPKDLCNRMTDLLSRWTGARWVVTVSSEAGGPTLYEQRRAEEQARFDAAARDPLVQKIQQEFPGAHVTRVTPAPEPEGMSSVDDMAPGETADPAPNDDSGTEDADEAFRDMPERRRN